MKILRFTQFINECVRLNTGVSNVKHSYEISRVDEGKLSDKAKALIAKLSTKITSLVNKFKSFFDKKISKIDSANAKLEALLK